MNFFAIKLNYEYNGNSFAKEYICALKENKTVGAMEKFTQHMRTHYKDITIIDIYVKRLPDTYEWFKEFHYLFMLS